MKKWMVIFILLVAVTTHAQDYDVVSVKADSAVIKDRQTNRTMKVKTGEELGDGWSVTLISEEVVVIEKSLSYDERIRGILPVDPLKRKKK